MSNSKQVPPEIQAEMVRAWEMNRPAPSLDTLARVTRIVEQHERSRNYLGLARAEVIDTLRAILSECGRVQGITRAVEGEDG